MVPNHDPGAQAFDLAQAIISGTKQNSDSALIQFAGWLMGIPTIEYNTYKGIPVIEG